MPGQKTPDTNAHFSERRSRHSPSAHIRIAIRDSVESETASATIEFSPSDRDALGLNAVTHTIFVAETGTSSPVQFGAKDVRTRFNRLDSSGLIKNADIHGEPVTRR
jgi:hypothetical protein